MSIAALVYIDASGFHFPDYPTVLEYYKSQYRGIYGDDVYLEADSQDGQWLAIEARAAYDLMSLAASVHNSFSPSSAQGVGLSRVVKTNGIRRRVATRSTVALTIVGQIGTVIVNGQAKDNLEQKWDLPASVTIPPAGQIVVTATAADLGAVIAPPNSITTIATPTRGWQSVTNVAAAVEGVPVESDAELRMRQAVSTSLPALTPLGALAGALANLANVSRVKVYENLTDAVDANGLPGRSISAVVEGGDLVQIATTIGQKKTPGAGTYGTTAQAYVDPQTTIPYSINFFQLGLDTVKVQINGTPLVGFTTETIDEIKASVAASINAHSIGETVEYSGMWAPAYRNSPARSQPYKIDNIQIAFDGDVLGTADLAVAFNRAVACTPDDVTVQMV